MYVSVPVFSLLSVSVLTVYTTALKNALSFPCIPSIVYGENDNKFDLEP